MKYVKQFLFIFLLVIFMISCSKQEKIGWNAASRSGVVAAGNARSVAAGIEILDQGGNAADAAAATILALAITDFGAFCIGGEVPFMIYDAEKQEVKVLSGQGAAPLNPKAMEWYYKNGIPMEDIQAAAVPAVVDLCVTALVKYGTLTFNDVVAPALRLLEGDEEAWYPDLALTFRKLIDTEQTADGTREEKLRAVSDRFYRGDIADELDKWYRENGGLLTKEDLAAHTTRIEDPVTIKYRGYDVYKCNTWTQGPVLCQTLRLLEGFDLATMGHLSPDYIHTIVESFKLSFADRDFYYADPLFQEVPLDALFSDAYTKIRRPLINMEKASYDIRPGDPVNLKPIVKGGLYRPGAAGTTTCCVADRWGNVVAATPSGWGSNAGPAGNTGIVHGTRLRSLNTDPDHTNRIEPGKRPRITLTPTLVLKKGKPVLAISVVGGDVQDQTTMNLLLDFVEFGMMPADAVTAPRFATGHHEDSFNPASNRRDAYEDLRGLWINNTVQEDIIQNLKKRGHEIRPRKGAIGDPVMIYIEPESGMMYAAGDPDAGRHAAGM